MPVRLAAKLNEKGGDTEAVRSTVYGPVKAIYNIGRVFDEVDVEKRNTVRTFNSALR
jgi:chromosome condensin MukBEF complex kleisin-like MukF subunit